MTPAVTLEEVARQLDLPAAEDVADLLREHGVKGSTGSPKTCVCPVAEFVSLMVGFPVAAGPQYLIPMVLGTRPPVSSPRAVGQFMRRFDTGDPAFADLVAP